MEDGTITMVPDDDGCGFIRPAHGRDDVSFLRSALTGASRKQPQSGDHVTFTISFDLFGKGPRASAVQVVAGPKTSDKHTGYHEQRYS